MSLSETVPYKPHAPTLEEALLEYERAAELGSPLDPKEFLFRYSHLASELGPLLEAREFVEQRACRFRKVLAGDSLSFPDLPEYEILEELGRGGMGVVYKAWQRGTEQLVALKMLRSDWLATLGSLGREAAIQQFNEEAKLAAQLRHPNRVPILHLGTHDGFPYYVMELVEGCSLATKLKQDKEKGEGTAYEYLRYLASVAEAVHEAHENELPILHRDIKPHNILIDERTNEARLTDFGLATFEPTASQADEQQTKIGGTLPYMPPEALDGKAEKASDVYSLGVTLYELLTGSQPFLAKTREELESKIRTEPPGRIRKENSKVAPQVEKICLKCLHKNPKQRYSSAKELADLLRGYLQADDYARNFTTMGTLFIGLGPIVLLINLSVYALLQISFAEPVIWLLIFSTYPALFSVFLLAPKKEAGRATYLSQIELWSVWGGKMFAAIAISVALRIAFLDDPHKAMRMAYSVFASLSGMAVFVMVVKMPRILYLLAFGCWIVAIGMMFDQPRTPVYYGVYAAAGTILYGSYLRKLGAELG